MGEMDARGVKKDKVYLPEVEHGYKKSNHFAVIA